MSAMRIALLSDCAVCSSVSNPCAFRSFGNLLSLADASHAAVARAKLYLHFPDSNFPIQWKHHMNTLIRSIAALLILIAITACATTDAIVAGKLQTISSGHTGCEPADNVISNVHADAWGTGTWHATCHGKLYRCSGTDNGQSIGCAPAVQ